MSEDHVLGLFKFGARSHMEELVKEGHLYMRPLSDFVSMETDALRADKDEALSHAFAAEGWELSIENDGQWTRVGTFSGALRFPNRKFHSVNVFCMYAFLSSQLVELVDTRNLAFGDTYVVFTDANEFLRRVSLNASRLNLELQFGLVEYVDPSSYRGSMGISRKFSTFSYQSEFRLALFPGSGTPYSLRVGNLSDIALLGSLAEINQRLRIVAD